MEASMKNDLELLRISLGGNQQAFGQIVERYQSLICAIAYSATGDLGLSEDLAQETFVTAWQRLAQVRDETKLRAWLCGIARNLIKNTIRRRNRDVAGSAKPLETIGQAKSEALSPRELAISKEKEAILWRALGEMPEIYREPMVLFYREQQSVQAVAEMLDLSVDAAKQRLSRGRKMLKEQVATFVEETLSRTRPTKAFAIAVLAALPAAAPQAAAAAVAATAAKGSVAAKSAAAAGLSGAVWGPLLGMLGAFIGVRASLRSTKSPRERRFVVKTIWIFGAYVLGFLGVTVAVIYFLRSVWAPSPQILTLAIIGLGGVYTIGLVVLIRWANRRQRQIQKEDRTYVEPRYQPMELSRGAIYGSFGGAVFGAVCWVFPMSFIAKDWIVAAVVLLAAMTIFALSTQAAFRAPQRYYRIAIGALLGVGVLNLAVVNLRWTQWMVAYRQSSLYQPGNDLPLWAVNVMIVGLVAVLIVMCLLMGRKKRAVPRRGKTLEE